MDSGTPSVICGRAILACPLKGVQNFVLPSQNAEGAPNLTLLLEGVSLQLEAERDTLTFKGYSNIYIRHVPKSTASTELTELVKGDGEIPIPLLHSISVSFGIYGYPTISPIGRIKVTGSYLQYKSAKLKTFSFGIRLDSSKFS